MAGKLFYLLLTVIGICCGSSHFTKSNYPDCNSSDIEFLDTCLLGKSVREALVKLNIDTSRVYAFDEPPGILRGIHITTDTTRILLYTRRKSIIDLISEMNYRLYYTLLLDSNIIGVSWRKPKVDKKKAFGSVIWYYED